MNAARLIALVFLLLTPAALAETIDIPTVFVGNVRNANDPTTGRGAVNYGYRMGKYEVTVGQYTAFLNAVARTDTYSLYNPRMATDLNIAGISRTGAPGTYSYQVIGSPNKPVTYVSWGDAARFVNWLHNRQPAGMQDATTTEEGAYSLDGANIFVFERLTRNAEARWFIPTENEWYKAAYHQPATDGGDVDDYWQYPTRSNSVPFSDLPPGSDAPEPWNVANIFINDGIANGFNDGYASLSPGNQNSLTEVGAYEFAPGPYGTYDQGGNVREWTERTFATRGAPRGSVRGGSWWSSPDYLTPQWSSGPNAYDEDSTAGFRVATVPEPTHLVAGAIAFAVWLCRRRTR